MEKNHSGNRFNERLDVERMKILPKTLISTLKVANLFQKSKQWKGVRGNGKCPMDFCHCFLKTKEGRKTKLSTDRNLLAIVLLDKQSKAESQSFHTPVIFLLFITSQSTIDLLIISLGGVKGFFAPISQKSPAIHVIISTRTINDRSCFKRFGFQ